ncbi:ATP-binding protein [Georgenia sp. AZ-5]|uniref:ATP-binding protein n=1 Tax=Georgenia sp. AZ-5 TaxID=3367526 RepID=UPI003754998E
MSAVDVVHPGQWRLDRVEVVNWGTFDGHHRLDVARKGFLLTGHSGSGKSSLVDAVAAVLVPRGKLRFNAAAADGASRRADRTTASYVRGAWRRRADETTGEVVSDYLRPGATWSGILLRYADGAGGTVSLVKLYHLRRGANTAAEAAELHVLLQEPVDLLDFQPFARAGLDVRRIKATWPKATVTDKHSAFSARFCRLLGISGESALILLHKTQSAKSLDNLDDLFRNFMLDEPQTRRMAETAVAQFGELSQAHGLVVEARRQVEALAPLPGRAAAYDQHTAAAARAAELRRALEPFARSWKHALAEQERVGAEAALHTAEHELALAEAATAEAQRGLDVARRLVAERGGGALEVQRMQVTLDEKAVSAATAARARLAEDLAAVGIIVPTTFGEYEELRATARAERDRLATDQERRREAALRLHEEAADLRRRKETIDRELRALKGARSNLGSRLLDARRMICHETGLTAATLPFAGELLQVRPEHAVWTGAIERVLRPLATVMLVPAAHRDAVAAAADRLHLGTRLAFEAVPSQVDPPRPARADDSLVHRVEVAAGPMAPWLHATLSHQYDYACVEDARDLHGFDRAVTRAGQVKRGRGRYEKDDRFRVDDRGRWVLGSDNTAKVEHFLGELRQVTTALDAVRAKLAAAERERDQAQRRADVLAALGRHEWSELDVEAAANALDRSRTRLAELRHGNTDLRAAEHEEQQAARALDDARDHERGRRDAVATARAALEQLDAVLADLAPSVDAAPVPHQGELERRFHEAKTTRVITHAMIDKIALAVATGLEAERDAASEAAREAEKAITRITGDFRRRWPALAGDLTDHIDDRAGFLDIHARLQADRLPEFEQRFFDLLESQSRRNVGQLANEIRRAPAEIRERIAPVNASLRRSRFDEGRYLQIKVDDNRSAAAREFLADLQTIASDSWMDRDRDSAEATFAVMERLMHRLMSSEGGDRAWQELCLDTRRHVRFTGVEVDEAGQVVSVHDSGSGLSGGQKQKLVVFCLAAALRYQLAADAEETPTYGTVILDEAFDKADSAFTRMAMDIFQEFGFHMVLATPLKLLQTLEDYVGGIGLATCRDRRQSSVGVVAIDDAGLVAAMAESGASAVAETLPLDLPS